MGYRKVTIKKNVAERIAAISFFIESKGMVNTAEKFVDGVYDFFIKLSDTKRSFAICRNPEWKALGYKCVSYKKKYTIAFIESDTELTICEFAPSKLVRW